MGHIPTKERYSMAIRARLTLAATTVLLFSGCDLVGVGPDIIGEALNESQALWAEQGLTDYRFEFFGGCSCSPEFTQWVTVTVRNGEVLGVEAGPDGLLISDDISIDAWATVPELFQIIRDALEGNGSIEWLIEAEFHATSGYPTRIVLSPRDSGITDAGLNYVTRNLVPLD